MKLSKRLLGITNFIDKGKATADIGTDHAFIPIFLVKNGICEKVIASDIKKGPADKAKKNIILYGCQEQIEVRIGSGLDVLYPGEAQTIIIAGMGGLLIEEILEQGMNVVEKVESLILQPMTHHFELRQWLCKNKYSIIDEDLVKEGNKLYLILKVLPEYDTKIDEDGMYFGRILFDKKHPLLKEYILKNIKELKSIRGKLLGKDTQDVMKKLDEVDNRIRIFQKALKRA